jgi:D-aspartate ligase
MAAARNSPIVPGATGAGSERRLPVIALGSGITALGVVRSLGRARLRPHLVAKPGDFATRSRWVRGRLLHIPESDDPEALLAGLELHGVVRSVLIPATDTWSTAVSRLPAEARTRFPTSMPSPAILDMLVDKGLFAAALTKHGVPHPRTILVESEADLDTPDFEQPFLKPRNSQLFAQHYHAKAFTFTTPAEARAAYRRIEDAGLTAVLQEYIPGPSSDHIFVDGFVDRTGVVRATFARRRVRMYPPDFGNSTLTISMPREEAGSAIGNVTRFLEGIGYRGIFSAEFKRDARDGEFKILEINSRPWWYIGFAAHCGVDVASMAYRDAIGLAVEDVHDYRVGARCVLLPQDVRAYVHSRRHNRDHPAFREWLDSWIGATPTVLALDDPLPALTVPSVVAHRRVRRSSRG